MNFSLNLMFLFSLGLVFNKFHTGCLHIVLLHLGKPPCSLIMIFSVSIISILIFSFFSTVFFVYTFCFFTKCTIVHNDEMQPFENGLIIIYDVYLLLSYCITILLCFGHSHYLSLQSGVT